MHIYSEIQYLHNNIGYFPEFKNHIKHGFSWGEGSGNMSFSVGNQNGVRENVQAFLEILDLGPIEQSLIIKAEHSDNIIDITGKLPESKNGIELNCDAVITQLSNTTLTLKPGDCTSVILHTQDQYGKPLIALVHHGRRGVELKLPIKIVNHLIDKYGVNVKNIKIGILPHLFKENRKFENIEGLDKNIWDGYLEFKDGYYYPMETEFAIDQYKSVGILDQNISLYNVDTYEAARTGESFSYKYSLEMEKKHQTTIKGRFIVGIQLL